MCRRPFGECDADGNLAPRSLLFLCHRHQTRFDPPVFGTPRDFHMCWRLAQAAWVWLQVEWPHGKPLRSTRLWPEVSFGGRFTMGVCVLGVCLGFRAVLPDAWLDLLVMGCEKNGLGPSCRWWGLDLTVLPWRVPYIGNFSDWASGLGVVAGAWPLDKRAKKICRPACNQKRRSFEIGE